MFILLVEDDKSLAEILCFRLQKDGHSVEICYDGEEALYCVSQSLYDLILLDRMLPSMDGITVLTKLREKNIHAPVILLTALGSLEARVEGLDSGADDYLAKPFAYEELAARIRCLSRRMKGQENSLLLQIGSTSLAMDSRLLTGPDGSVFLSKKECNLLGAFMHNQVQVLERSTLLLRVWGMDSEVEECNLDTYIHFLRNRLKQVHSRLSIKTVRGVGYRLDPGTEHE